METLLTDEQFLEEALHEARQALNNGECAVGAVLVRNNTIIARSGNREVALKDPTAHAEILVIREACQLLNSVHLPDCTLYTTLIPCPMCYNATLQAHIPRVVYGSKGFEWIKNGRFNPQNVSALGPLMEEPCRAPFVKWAVESNRCEILDADDLKSGGRAHTE